MTISYTHAPNPVAAPVAVIGMSCRLPGGIDSPHQLWQALLRGEDFVAEVPAERWDADSYYDPEPGMPGRTVSRWGAFLPDVGGFDAEFFGMTDPEATAIDPQHRLLLETSWEAVEHAGLDPAALAGAQAGVFVGLTQADYELLSADCGTAEGPYGFTGTNHGFASGRVSHALGLHGPAVTVDTAGSSGLTAVHLACRSLQDGESDLALAGGVSVMFEPRRAIAASRQGRLSPTGRCHAFDAAADGSVAGEACVVLLLKRLPDAVRDRDRILAVLRGTAANQDGRGPAGPAQIAVYRAALAAAGVEADTVGMVEAHGAGIPAGDQVEYAGLATVYGTAGRCALGSVKTNFGHCQSAAGPLGLMKTILALQHGVVPQNLHFSRLPDQLAEVSTELFVPQQATPWPTNGRQPRRAAVSSQGGSGSNVHAIVEQAPPGPSAEPPAPDRPLLFPISATSVEQLPVTAGRLADWVDEQRGALDGTGLADLGYTLSRRRGHRPVRTAVAADRADQLSGLLREIAGSDNPYRPAVGQDDLGPVWVFSGEGSQWAGMGAALLANEPVFAATIAAMEPVIAAESGFSVTEALSAPDMLTGIDRVQPAIFAVQVGLAETLLAAGVRPGAVIGQSLGEAAAAVVSGGLSLEDGLRVVCRCSKLLSRIAGTGAMAAVELPAQQVLSEFSIRDISDVVLSVVAAPTSTVVGGDAQTVRDLVTAWAGQGVPAREVPVQVAWHSPLVEPLLDELAAALADLAPAEPNVPYYSATLWSPRDRPSFNAGYWTENLRYTARFAAAVQSALKDGYRVFGELAPDPLLLHAVEQCADSLDTPVAALAAMRREQRLPLGLAGFVTELYSAGAAVDFSAQYPAGRLVDAPLPTWTHRELILSRDAVQQKPHGAAVRAVHPLLGAHVHLLEEPERHVWLGDVGTTAHPWLGDHQLRRVAVLPGAAYCEMALAAARASLGDESEARDVRFEQQLPLAEQTALSAAATVVSPGVLTFTMSGQQGGDRAGRASATLQAAPEAPQPPARDIAALIAAHPIRVDGDDLRKMFDGLGIQYGPAFAGLAAAYTADGQASAATTVLAEVAPPGSIRAQQASYRSHPALLDACFQSVVAHPDVQAAGAGRLLLPVGVRRLRCYQPTGSARYCLVQVTAARPGACEADLQVLDASGTVLMIVEGLQLAAELSEHEHATRTLNDRLVSIEWERHDPPDAAQADPGCWLLLSMAAAGDALTARLGAALNADGAHCTTLSVPLSPDHPVDAAQLRARFGDALRADGPGGTLRALTGVVVLTAPPAGGDRPRQGRDLVSYLVNVAGELAAFRGESPRLHLVTRNAAAVRTGEPANLEQAGLRGLLRVVDAEHPQLRASQIDIDDTGGAADEADEALAARLAAQLRSGSDEDETAWREGGWYTARLRPAPLLPSERRTTVIAHGRDGMRLQLRIPGELDSLESTAHPRVAPGPGQIEVAVAGSSVNFADVLVASGRYPGFDGQPPQLGTDFAGVVTAVGPGVTEHRVGDQVAGISGNGCWSTFVLCDARLAVTLPAEVPLGEAAALPTGHATAWYGLHELARISSTDKVLIHCGSGSVGRAAIAIAAAAGCEIFATAGDPRRRQVLRDLGIERVYDSRTVKFAERIRHDTDGYGVDVVLNSLPGAAQRAGIEALASGGRFIEIGKWDSHSDTRLGLLPLRRNLSLHVVDLALLADSHPETVRRLLTTVYRQIADGVLPLPPTTHFPVSDAAAALRLVAAGEHTGKVLLDVPDTGRSVAVVSPADAGLFRADGAYLVTGGTGGRGLFLAAEMAAAGCGRIVLNSRSAPDEHARQAIERLRAAGADIAVECGDIAEPGTADRLVAVATETGLPVRGVLHAAAVLEEAPLADVTDELIDHCWAPKVDGAWNLHQALRETEAGRPLDWFCVFSSSAALIGFPGQAGYAAANSWLDAFAHWRRAQGLPATAIAWGAGADIGPAGAPADDADGAITPAEAERAFQDLLSYDRPYSGYLPATGTPRLTALAQRSRFAAAFRARAGNRADSGKILAELARLPRDEWPGKLRRLVSDQISLLLRRSIDPDRPLSDYGLDSLSNLELRTRIETETGIRIGPTQITTVQDLAEHLGDQLAARLAHPELSDAG